MAQFAIMSIFQPIQEILASISGSNAGHYSELIKDYWICLVSREVSLLGRREVLTGKAKFGILGDGKEVPQVALARAFRKGDFRSGYYRDQTLMFALGLCTVQEYFAQLYADCAHDPFSKGRQMNAHFATPLIDGQGDWLDHRGLYNVTADISSTGGQMARALGIALASKYYREHSARMGENLFSDGGREVSFVTIGDASTSEGVFWETLNAAAVLQVPLAVCVWDDGYGISVPIHLQTVKQSISRALAGFEANERENGMLIFTAKAWDYVRLVQVFQHGTTLARDRACPVLFHIEEVTQPQGHSTSGSHERYKSKDRMKWEEEHDCITKMSQWLKSVEVLDSSLDLTLRDLAKSYVREEKNTAWNKFIGPNLERKSHLLTLLEAYANHDVVRRCMDELQKIKEPQWFEMVEKIRELVFTLSTNGIDTSSLLTWLQEQYANASKCYNSHLYCEGKKAATNIREVTPIYSERSPEINGYQILNNFFDKALEKYPAIIAFGEDVGKIGDVNQGFAGLQEKYGEDRIFDTGIREWTIVGQAIGLAMRGFRPIAEIQYLDYIVYALSPLMDDLATLHYRSAGMQKAPAIIRTRGHRLEGIWHSGSPIGMLLHSLRGMVVCVPRNMVQAAGMYNTLLQSDDPALVIECLNGYRIKEKLPDNMGDYTVPIGKVEILQQGTDVTLVSYGSCIRIAQRAIERLKAVGISVELIDVQTLLPFDLNGDIAHSVKKTNKLVILDEDVPGGASSYILREIIETQDAFKYLDMAPITITAKANRPPYGSDGDYFVKPNTEDVCEAIYHMMSEYHPLQYQAVPKYR